MWSSRPTVIFGRNQDMEAEVNLPYCRENGVELYRRKSGGGCVYSDRGNLMLSYITPEKDVRKAFADYLERLCAALRSLGLEAVASSRNDVMVGDRKVSGNACFAARNASIVHGTLLYDVDFDALAAAITPPAEKLERHGVKSVRQRVANLHSFLPELGLPRLKESLVPFFSEGECVMPGSALLEILDLERFYLDKDFIEGRKSL